MNYLYLFTLIALVSCLSVQEQDPKLQGDQGTGGRTGTIACTDSDTSVKCLNTFEELMSSHIHRSKGSKILSYVEEKAYLKKGELPSSYRPIPDPKVDNDKKITPIIVGDNGLGSEDYGNIDCGLNPPGLVLKNNAARLNDCKERLDDKNLGKSIWDGARNGQNGEGEWRIMYRDNTNDITLWVDTKTNLVWSDELGNYDWNEASGYFPQGDENSKGVCSRLNELTKSKDHPNGQIAWRLPNRNEFFQADLNGARYVLANTEKTYWSASISDDLNFAWAITQSTGVLEKVNRAQLMPVRCIGVMID